MAQWTESEQMVQDVLVDDQLMGMDMAEDRAVFVNEYRREMIAIEADRREKRRVELLDEAELYRSQQSCYEDGGSWAAGGWCYDSDPV